MYREKINKGCKMIKTIVGPMHSGKTSELMLEYNKIFNKKHVLCFKPFCDVRDEGYIRSNDFDIVIPCIQIVKFSDILKYITDEVKTIFVDEAQFVKGSIKPLLELSMEMDKDIYLVGLNMTAELKPFLVMPKLMAISDEVKIIKASCYDCGREANYTYYEGDKKTIMIGNENYYPLCGKCYIIRKNKMLYNKKNSSK